MGSEIPLQPRRVGADEVMSPSHIFKGNYLNKWDLVGDVWRSLEMETTWLSWPSSNKVNYITQTSWGACLLHILGAGHLSHVALAKTVASRMEAE